MRIAAINIAIILMYNTSNLCMDEFYKDIKQMKREAGAIVGLFSPVAGTLIRGEDYEAIAHNPYKDIIAQTIQRQDICEGEKEYLKNRLPIVKAALERLLNRHIADDQIPNIAIVNSGGGYRAMLYTLGALHGAEKIGLLDATTYVTGLSGSTWAIAPWICLDMPLEDFKHYIVACTEKPFMETTDEEEILIFEAAAVKTASKQPKTPVDIYGDFLGNRLLEAAGDKRHMVYLSHQAEKIKDGRFPYPIYTAIDADEHTIENQDWYEFTPHEIGNIITGNYIPAWSYGRKFKNEKSVDNDPEKPLGYHMGTWGSAFGANIKTIKKEIAKAIGCREYIKQLPDNPIDGQRIGDFYAKIANPLYKIKKDEPKYIGLVDAGLDFNLPYPPVSGLCPNRKADVLIFCDASAGKVGNELKKTVDYAHKHNLPFPAIDFCDIDTKTISIFKDEHNPAAPVVIYMPRISDQKLWECNKHNNEFVNFNLDNLNLDTETNEGFAQTIHFQYEPENTLKVIHQAEFNMRVNQAALCQALAWAIERKK